MLSPPPARSASWTSRSAHASTSAIVAIVSSMVSALTKPDRPSEHSSHRSPLRASRTDRSGVTSGSKSPSTRITTDRCGWCSASSGRDPADVHQVLHERVVRGDLREDAVAHQVPARVAQVHHRELVAGAQDGEHRRAHAAELRVGVAARDDLVAGVGQSRLQLVQRVVGTVRLAVQRRERGDGDRGRDIAARVPAHAVRDHQQVRTGVRRVLVVGAHESDIGPRRISECDGHRVTSAARERSGPRGRVYPSGRESEPRRAGPPRMSRSSIRGPRRTTGRPAGRSARAATTSSRRPGRACSPGARPISTDDVPSGTIVPRSGPSVTTSRPGPLPLRAERGMRVGAVSGFVGSVATAAAAAGTTALRRRRSVIRVPYRSRRSTPMAKSTSTHSSAR